MTHQDYVDGYMDGYDLNAPLPTENRSARYRHSFNVGRAEKTGKPLPISVISASLKVAELADGAVIVEVVS